MPTVPSPELTALCQTLRQAGDLRVFVETGSGRGDFSAVAGDIFDTVITMEADTALYEAAHERLSGHKGHLPLTGDTREMLPNLMPRLAAPGVFWLASHLGLEGDAETPLLAELSAVTGATLGHVVCIPGADILLSDRHRPAGWPTPAALLTLLGQGAARNVGLRDNVILAVPQANTRLWGALFPDGATGLDLSRAAQ